MTALRELGYGKFVESKKGILLDIGCGASKATELAVGMDHQPLDGVDIVHDWNDFPWPLEDECVLTAFANHVVEHVNPADGHFLDWMNEVWRVLKPRGQFMISYPYGVNSRYVQDPTHCNPCNEVTWMYLAPRHESQLWQFYKPKPWDIEQNLCHLAGDGQVILRKLSEDWDS